MLKSLIAAFTLLTLIITSAHAQFYTWFTDREDRPLGIDNDYQPFGPDSGGINGTVRSNDTITIAGSGWYDRILTHAPFFIQGPGYDPHFAEPPVFNVLPVQLPDIAALLRQYATNYYDPGSNKQMRIRIVGSVAHVYTWDWGVAFDSLLALHEQMNIWNGTCIFTESPLELEGRDVIGKVTVGSAQMIRITNDVRVGGPTSGPPEYRVSSSNDNYIGIVSEGDIKIGNTTANGRENSAGLGFAQNNPELTDIVITAAIEAMGSFTFEQQNDSDSVYVCDCSPDWRGQIYLYGSVVQGRHGYLSRSNNEGTGYSLQLRFDTRLLLQRPPCFFAPSDSNHATPDTLDFGDVVVAQTAVDTAHVYVVDYSTLGMAMANPPFAANPVLPQFGYHFSIPVSFTPPYAGNFSGVLQVTTSYDFFQIALRGHGVPGFAPPPVEPMVYPNPFNATTTFTFELADPGRVTAQLFDISGRLVTTLTDDTYTAGVHHLPIAGQALASGLYLIRLHTPSQERNLKLMLIK
jgi:hypothetical protein